MSGERVSARDLAKEVPKEVLDALLELEGRGWRIQRGGHKLQVYCPCGQGGAIFRVGGTPSNPEQRRPPNPTQRRTLPRPSRPHQVVVFRIDNRSAPTVVCHKVRRDPAMP